MISNVTPSLPQAFSTAAGTISGVMDGVNPTFTIGVVCRFARVYRNGQRMTPNVDACFSGNAVVFLGEQIPQAGDGLLIYGYV